MKKENTKLTEKELQVLSAFLVSNYGDHTDAIWTWEIRENSGLNAKSFSGICGSLTKKGLIISDSTGDPGMKNVKIEDTYTMELTAEGIKAIESLIAEKTKTEKPKVIKKKPANITDEFNKFMNLNLSNMTAEQLNDVKKIARREMYRQMKANK